MKGAYICDQKIRVGSDSYLVHIMSSLELADYINMVRDHPELKDIVNLAGHSPFIVQLAQFPVVNDEGCPIGEEPRLILRSMSIGTGKKLFKDSFTFGRYTKNGGWDISDAVGYTEWFPCLIPLGRNGENIQESFWKDNPDGSLVSGFYFLVNGKPYRAASKNSAQIFTTCACETDLNIVDGSELKNKTEKRPLDWIAFRGMLVPAEPLCYVAKNKLPEHAFLPTLGGDNDV